MGTSNSAQLRNLAAARDATSILEQVLAESKRASDSPRAHVDKLDGHDPEPSPPETEEPL